MLKLLNTTRNSIKQAYKHSVQASTKLSSPSSVTAIFVPTVSYTTTGIKQKQKQQHKQQQSDMSVFNEFDVFRRNIGDMFTDFERSFFPHHTMYPMLTDLTVLPLLTDETTGKQGDTEERKEQEPGTQVSTTGQQALQPFGGLNLRAPVQIKLDVSEDDKNVYINGELPGVKKEDIKVSVRDHILTIEAEKKEEKKEEDPKTHKVLRSERVYGKASRAIRLPKYADDTKMNAKFENGVLRMTIPKKPEEKKPETTVKVE